MKQIRRKRISIIAVLVFILSLTLTASLVYADNIVLTDTNPDTTITTGTTATVYGSSGANHVTIESGAKATLINFTGSNTITINADSSLFTVSRSGSAVTFQGSDGTWLKIFSTGTEQVISFNDITKKLVTRVMFGDQIISNTSSGIDDSGEYQPAGDTFTNSLGMKFNLIPAGTFTMGGSPDEPTGSRELPQHQVTLTQSYYMQTTEVTQGQWKAVMGWNPSSFADCGDNCPVKNVSWEQVQGFITKLNAMGQGTYSLPTEAQWEYAARAGSTTAFANGGITELYCGYDANLDKMGWYCYNSESKTHPVAQKSPNFWGLYDMHGNVLEWCQDWYGSYSTDAVTDPVGPGSGSYRVIRGGCWFDNAQFCRSAVRYGNNPSDGDVYLGFRLVCSAGHQ